jgi:beta-galactosidase
MIHLGTQYYRPPFPNAQYWEDDIKRMADAGLNTLQLWVVWAWVESKPGEFCFDDYDRLVELADAQGLDVVLSTIAAIHPYWIHRRVPGSEMVDNFGHKVVSSNRGECHFGLTPGGCIDHPGVWARMSDFLTAVGTHYRDAPNLVGWDAWNELRWNVQADGLVCYCPSTLQRFRVWLDEKYGGLEGLNAAWQRRYSAWEDVFPGKCPNRPYTEMMAFEDFITWRAVQHAYDRYEVLTSVDAEHPVTVHGGQPTVLHGHDSYPNATALHRGNDWDFAERIDGVGCSSFPLWGGREMDRAGFINRLEFVASARQGKRFWLSELQGGRSNIGFTVAQSVPAAAQQTWVWTGLSAGADTVLFWCWRDEVFGRESTGFGLAGNDGMAEERMAAMRRTGDVLQRYGDVLRAYEPDPARVGILFSPQSYYLYWAQEGDASKPLRGIQGYARALVRSGIPYRIVEEEHLDALEGLDLLILPRVVVMDDDRAERLADFVRAGGTLVCESEVGAFGSNGLYRYPEDRHLAELIGVQEIGRRRLTGETVTLALGDAEFVLPAAQWRTPMGDEDTLLTSVALGEGRVVLCGTYLGDAYLAALTDPNPAPDAAPFEAFVARLVGDAVPEGRDVRPATVVAPAPSAEGFVHVRVGRSGEGADARALAFVFAPQPETAVELAFPAGTFPEGATELLSGEAVEITRSDGQETVVLGPTDWGVAVLLAD